MKPRIVVMRASSRGAMKTEEYYWLRIVGANNEIMLDSEEYSSKGNALRAAKKLSKVTGLEIK